MDNFGFTYKTTMNLNLTAHDILGHLSKKQSYVSGLTDGTPTYRPMMYEWVTFDSLCKMFQKRNPKEVRFSIEELLKNGHAETRPVDDWKEVRATQSGEIAFEKGIYVKAANEEKADQWDNLKIRYWWVPVIGSFIMGNILVPMATDYIKRLRQPKATVQSSKTIEKNHYCPTKIFKG